MEVRIILPEVCEYSPKLDGCWIFLQVPFDDIHQKTYTNNEAFSKIELIICSIKLFN